MEINSTPSVEKIEELLPGHPKFELHAYASVGSTNDIVKQAACGGAPEWFTAIAARQTAGRGKTGRVFFSPQGSGIYFSVLLRPAQHTVRPLSITAMAAVAAAETIEEICGRRAGIKWVNDILIDGRKVCGILTEAAISADGSPLHAVLGVGVNITPPKGGFPPEIADIAGALFEKPAPCAGERIAAGILGRFSEIYLSASGEYVDEYRARSVLIGREITVLKKSGPARARVLDTDNECRLVVRYENNVEEALSSGDISVNLIL